MADQDVQFCKGPDLGDGCGGTFPRKTATGLCPLCEALARTRTNNPDDAAALAKLRACPQCLHCGKFGQNVLTKCVTCARLDAANSTSQENALRARTAANQVRPQAWQMRTNGGSQAPPGGAQLARNLPRNNEQRYINVSVLPWLSNKLYARIGVTSRSYKENTPFEEVVEDIMKVWSSAWDGAHPASLIRSEILIFWHNHVNLHEHSTDGTLGEFYDIHSQLRNSDTLLDIPRKYKSVVKGTAIVLIFMIDYDAFQKHTRSKVGRTITKRRRSGANDEDDDDEPRAKRHAGVNSVPVGLTSNYMGLKVPAKAAPPATDVQLEFLHWTRGADDMFPWVGKTLVKGRLTDNPLHTGKEKLVFRLEVDGALYVAKRFRAVPTDIESFHANSKAMIADLTALHNTQVVLDAFYDAAADIQGDIDCNLGILETFIAAEVIDSGSHPSVASGISAALLKTIETDEDVDDLPLTPRVHWLIQRRTGNLFTIGAISHFFADMEISPSTPLSEINVLSHFQTTTGKVPGKAFGKLIIDVTLQNETTGGPRRLADHGPQGINMVLNVHVCNRVCELLLLPEVKEVTEDEGSVDDSR
ncbi:hypothetical protein B0H13DRAFT_2670306 [Mycena leptocephala]|nr:hypothetical protein B0H13DRAFT_2670306 [Mycena leptocephala]